MPALTEKVRVLVVDDERIIADSMAMILKVKNYEGRAAYSAEEAIVTAVEFRPDAMISDVVMGGMNGIELAIYLAEQQPDCQVLLILGNPQAVNLMEEATERGHHRTILNKPVHPEQILRSLSSVTVHRML